MGGVANSQLTVLRLALRGGDGPASRQRAERLLAATDLRPASMPSGAILVVRSLRVGVTLSDTPPPAIGWSLALRTRLERLYQEAARPARGPVPPGALSVLFTDTAELLACLTRDLLNDRAMNCWYWRQTLRDLAPVPGRALAAAWQGHAEALPSALAQLGFDQAHAALLLLRPAEVSAIVRALHAAYQLPATIFAPPSTSTNSPADTAERPWHVWLPSKAIDVTPQAEYLLGMSLALWCAPTLARSTPFAERAAAWLHAELAAHDTLENIVDCLSDAPKIGVPEPIRSTHADPQTTVEHNRAPSLEHPTPYLKGSVISAASIEHPTPYLNDSVVPALSPHEDGMRSHGAAALPVPEVEQPAPIADWAVADGVWTALGGALYLINLLASLQWPAWHAADGKAAIGGWAVLEALVHGLLGPADARYTDDPLWAALAALDGRSPDVPIADALPADAAGWLALSVARGQATLARWLADDAPEAAEQLLCTRGRLVLSRTHVDLYMSLNSIAMAARRTGLDRDPGWVPQLGRVVLFHFD